MTTADVWSDAVAGLPESAERLGARLSRVLSAADEATLDPAAVTCIAELCHFAAVDRGFVALFDEHERVARHWLWGGAGRPFALPPDGSRLEEISSSLAGLLRIGRALPIGEIDDIAVVGPDSASAEANGEAPRDGMIFPVLVSGDLVGLLSLQSMEEPRVWTRTFVAEMETLAELVVRLLGRTQERQALLVANARARRIAAHLPDGLVMVTMDGRISWVSPSFETMLSMVSADLEQRPFASLVSPTDRARLLEKLDLVSGGVDASVAVRISDPSGDWRWADLSLCLASEPHSSLPDEVVITVRDTHDRHLREMQLIAESDRDPLTGLANRAALERFLGELSNSDAVVTVAFCDVDDFKSFNDRLGHDTGDDILRSVASAIGRSVRSRDMVARLGGDEFVVVVVDPAQDAPRLGDRLINAVRAVAAEGKGAPTVSVGICGPGPGRTARQLLRRADEAMYSAKRDGKDRWLDLPEVAEPEQ